jgi:hypothetical protein
MRHLTNGGESSPFSAARGGAVIGAGSITTA